MISEKTVELNLSTELINHISYRNRLKVFAIAPTQRAEGKLGYDVNITFGNCSGILIQYKRAYINGNEYIYHLNYTANEDQHEILLNAENRGHLVLYAFPLFHTINEIRTYRKRLLLHTAWFYPSQIDLPGGSRGRHDLHRDNTTSRWYVTSNEPRDVERPLDFEIVNKLLRSKRMRGERDLSKLIDDMNAFISKHEKQFNISEKTDIANELSEQFIIGISEHAE